MKKRVLVIAAALLAGLPRVAAGADYNLGHLPTNAQKPTNAEKVLTVLGYIGVNNHEVKSFVGEMNTHIHGNKFNLHEEHMMGGTFSLHYQFQAEASDLPTIGRRRSFELSYSPDNSRLQATARPGSLILGMHWHFQ